MRKRRINKEKLAADNPLVDSDLVKRALEELDELDSTGIDFPVPQGFPIAHTEMRPDDDSERESEITHLAP